MLVRIDQAERQAVLQGGLTELDSVVSKPEAGQNHLTKTKARTKSRKEADGHDTQYVDKDDDKGRVNIAQSKDGNGQGANGKGGDHHVGGQPLQLCTVRYQTHCRWLYEGVGRAANQSANLAHASI